MVVKIKRACPKCQQWHSTGEHVTHKGCTAPKSQTDGHPDGIIIIN